MSLTGSRNVLSGGGTGTQLAGFGSSMPDISGAAIQMPSLAQLEQGIGQSLSAFERNLSNMFDTLARNLASRPQLGQAGAEVVPVEVALAGAVLAVLARISRR